MPDSTPHNPIVVVTGPSGAGRATAINVLEDLGFEAIDNMPLRMVPRLFDGGPLDRPLAIGIDVRNRDFSLSALLGLHTDLVTLQEGQVSLLYLECRPDVLLRRFSETRRRHPLAPDDTPEEGIAQEIELLKPIEDRADIVIDTSDLSPHDLKTEVHHWFADQTAQKLSVSLQSFSYKRGIQHGVDMVFDCRFLANPHWDETLRAKTGLDADVEDYVARDPRLAPFLTQINGMLGFLLPEIEAEGKTHFAVGLGCTGGQHRSVVVTERVAAALAETGWRVSISHKELSRRGLATSASRPAGPDGGKVAE
ncbi:RNase adapter RapZ [Marivita sp. S6314]|uniref:RNase adapter RapZ n=1 Tax=Marivita sp. S6314 TaxID=2926406 RepID=UPI001FF4981A|nr:RNase adapter RapZ [Marivita sp. S6314]MCK0150600.1 RNase adapter RapZ [Marivita sp. S6314]